MTEFREGQRVHVAFDAVIEYVHRSNDGLAEVRADDHDFSNSIKLEYITIADPANWPPQVGDVWEADGLDWYVRQYQGSLATFTVEPFDREEYPRIHYDNAEVSGSRNVDNFKALEPTLVRRRDAIVLRMLDDE